jgi:hypothetical protein
VPPAFREGDRPTRRVECARQVAQPVLAELRDLDPCLDRDRARPSGQLEPGRDRLVVPAEPPEQPSALDRDPLRRPWRVKPADDDPIPRRSRGPAADIGPLARVPPRQARRVVGRIEDGGFLADRDADRLRVRRHG